jgi:hypothetical protein
VKISTQHAAGYVTLAAMLPYLTIKTAWLLGSEIGVAQPGLMRTAPFIVGNLITALMELTGAALALALVHQWGQRLPAWLVLLPLWAAGGLLAPVMLAAPLGFLAGISTTPAADAPIDGLEGWVYAVVYAGFILQGTGLAVAFTLHVRTRWPHLLDAHLESPTSPSPPQAATSPSPPRAATSASPPRAATSASTPRAATSASPPRAALLTALGALVALTVTARLYWALGGPTGLTSELQTGRSLAQRALDASTATLALTGLIGLLLLTSHRPRTLRAWPPLTAAALGTGAMFCSGSYQLTLLIAPHTPFDPTGGQWFALLLSAQVTAGLLGATVLYRVRISTSTELVCQPG